MAQTFETAQRCILAVKKYDDDAVPDLEYWPYLSLQNVMTSKLQNIVLENHPLRSAPEPPINAHQPSPYTKVPLLTFIMPVV